MSPRHALRRAVADWNDLGYHPKVGIELEAYVFEPDGEGGWRPYHTPSAFVYGTGVMADPDRLIAEIMRRAETREIPIETINSEFDFPQWELTLEFGDALDAVDNIFLFQQLARETAFEFGLRLTFMGKPIIDKSGNGLHVNLSLSDAQGNNALADPAADDGLAALRPPVHRRAHRAPRGARRAVRPDRQRLQAAPDRARCPASTRTGATSTAARRSASPASVVPEPVSSTACPTARSTRTSPTAAVLQAARLGVVDRPDTAPARDG